MPKVKWAAQRSARCRKRTTSCVVTRFVKMKLIFLAIACLSVVSLSSGSEIRGSKAIEDRLALKRKLQLKTRQEIDKSKPKEDEIEPVLQQAADDKEDSGPEDMTTSTTSAPEMSSTAVPTTTTKALLQKPRPTTKPINNGRLIKTTTEKLEEEETTTKAAKPVRKPTEGPKQMPIIKPFDAGRRQSTAGNPGRPRPSTVVSVKPFKNLLAARLGANAKEAPAVTQTSTVSSPTTAESESDIIETTTKKPLKSRLLG